LAPIRSLAGSLRSLLGRRPATGHPDPGQELRQGLEVIEQRADSLGRFMGSYARLARLPRPALAPVEVGGWVRRVAAAGQARGARVQPGPAITVLADLDQLDQALINLLANAADAVGEAGGSAGGGITIGWARAGDGVELVVEDEGPGLAETTNLFVPFYTTKP